MSGHFQLLQKNPRKHGLEKNRKQTLLQDPRRIQQKVSAIIKDLTRLQVPHRNNPLRLPLPPLRTRDLALRPHSRGFIPRRLLLPRLFEVLLDLFCRREEGAPAGVRLPRELVVVGRDIASELPVRGRRRTSQKGLCMLKTNVPTAWIPILEPRAADARVLLVRHGRPRAGGELQA